MRSPSAFHIILKSELWLCNSLTILAILAWRLLFFNAHVELAFTDLTPPKKISVQCCRSRLLPEIT